MYKPSVRRRRMSLDEFLRFENSHAERHEFVAGEVFALSGGTLRHSRIIQNVSFTLTSRMRGGPCEVHSNIVKVQIEDERIYYPDVLVLCGRVPGDALVVHEPRVIVEVTSPSTVRADRGDKLDGYRRLTSLETYLIVDQHRRRVDRHWRDGDGSWQWEQYLVEGSLPVPRLEVPLTLDEIYEGIELPRVSEPDMEYAVEVAEFEE
jgi:Uma2 family endonuclease